MRDSFNEINITPLTDIFLVLLIIMMVIAPMLDQQGLNLAVPEIVDAENIQKDSKILNLFVTQDNTVLFDDHEVLISNLDSFFASNYKKYPDGLLIQADGDSDHGTIVKVMDKARNSGITSISIARN